MKIDAVAFDCDGVLVDARKSYDEVIRVVTEKMVKDLTGVKLPLAKAGPELISALRRTGGFNSDWDSTYALTMFAFVALSGEKAEGSPLPRIQSIVRRFGSEPRRAGTKDLDSFLSTEFPALVPRLMKARDSLGYPGNPRLSKLTTMFDKLYMGKKLYTETYGARFDGPPKGLISSERRLVQESTLRSLERKVGKGRLAIVTGRPSMVTAHTLGKSVMKHFNMDASMFIGDADLDPKLRAEYAKYRKPSPEALVRAKAVLRAKTLLYVGDSGEDLLMVRDGIGQGVLKGCLFAGVYGMSPDPEAQVRFFRENGADIVVKSVNEIPALISPAKPKRAKKKPTRKKTKKSLAKKAKKKSKKKSKQKTRKKPMKKRRARR